MVEAKKRGKKKKKKEAWRERTEKGERKEEEEKTKRGEDNEGKKGDRRIGNLGWERSSKIRRRSKEAGTRIFPQVYSYVWKETKWKNAHKEIMKSCYRN